MSDFEQWIQQNSFGMEHANGDIDLVVSTDDIRKYWQSMQGEAVGVINGCDKAPELSNGSATIFYSEYPAGTKLFTYPPSASAEIARITKELEEARKGLKAIETLIQDSEGVTGLHLNGDVAPWHELRTGGRFESWLLDFDAAIRQIGGGE